MAADDGAHHEQPRVYEHSRQFIGGVWRGSRSEKTVPITDPATETVIAEVTAASGSDVADAVAAAREAFDAGPWGRMSPRERSSVLHRFADAVSARRDAIVDDVVRQGGCTITQARGIQVYQPLGALYRYADLAARDPIEHFSVSGSPNSWRTPGQGIGTSLTVREPAGVAAVITPFNYPFFLNVHKVGAALAAGCTVVLKPTDTTCLDARHLADAAEECDLPSGVLNVLFGGSGAIGDALTREPGVDHVSFTGSTATGRKIMAAAAESIKRVTLELGGKSANVIFADADLDTVVAQAGVLVTRHCGQGCGALSRVLVERSRHDELVERMSDAARRVVVGPPREPATEMGPLASHAQRERVRRYISIGESEGAELRVGGDTPKDLDVGYYFAPTVFINVRNEMRIAQEEIFGPVVTVQAFDSEDEAVRLANDSVFGLNGAVWTGSLARGLRVAGRIRTGTITVNGGGSGEDLPYGGYKQSGLGREFGVWGVDDYCQTKSISYFVP